MLALSRRNSNAAEILLFLHKLASVLEEYFKELEEESIRDNFVIIYELLDEMMDFGYPQTTESKILQEYVLTIRFTDALALIHSQVHHTRITQTRDPSTSTDGRHKCGLLAQRGHPV